MNNPTQEQMEAADIDFELQAVRECIIPDASPEEVRTLLVRLGVNARSVTITTSSSKLPIPLAEVQQHVAESADEKEEKDWGASDNGGSPSNDNPYVPSLLAAPEGVQGIPRGELLDCLIAECWCDESGNDLCSLHKTTCTSCGQKLPRAQHGTKSKLSALPVAEPNSNFDTLALQVRTRKWVESRLGVEAMSPRERWMRRDEELIELGQSVGVTKEDVIALVDHVYSKPPGVPAQELGGAFLTLVGCAESLGYNLGNCAEAELIRIETLPPEKFRKRQELNAALGIGAPPTERSSTP